MTSDDIMETCLHSCSNHISSKIKPKLKLFKLALEHNLWTGDMSDLFGPFPGEEKDGQKCKP